MSSSPRVPGGFTHEYITRQTYEDLVWMVFGVAAVACTYLEDDCSLVFHQGRGGSDVCEHFFANMRNVNPNPNLQQCRQLASKNAHFIKSTLSSFKGRQNAAHAPRSHDDYLQPLYKRPKKK